MNNFIQPDWPAPANVKAYTTQRIDGVSQFPYAQFNLATHVGDNLGHVLTNRMLLKQHLLLPQEPIWLQQTHSNIALPALPHHRDHQADATFTGQLNQICIVLTADCLPILLCDRQGSHVAAIHAGWQGLAHGIIKQTLSALSIAGEHLLAWLGPAISAKHYLVDEKRRACFIDQNEENSSAFTQHSTRHWFADLYTLAQIQLKKHNVTAIYGGNYCTYSESDKFYSYRRDGEKTGRMASLIWLSSC